MKSVLAMALGATVASAEVAWYTDVVDRPHKYNERREWTNEAVAAGTSADRQFFLGNGWFAELENLEASLALTPTAAINAGTCAAAQANALTVTLDYVEMPFNGSASVDSAVCTQKECQDRSSKTDDETHQTFCVAARQGDFEGSNVNTEVSFSDLCVRTGSNVYSSSPALSSFTGPSLIRKASGFKMVRWFVRYNINVPAGCTGSLSLAWSGRTGIPQNNQCVNKRDTRAFGKRFGSEADPEYGNRTMDSADLPGLAHETHVTTSEHVSAGTTFRRVLGKAPMLDMTCVDIFMAPTDKKGACSDSEFGLIFNDNHPAMAQNIAGTRNKVQVTEYHDCSIFTNRDLALTFEDATFESAAQLQMPDHFFQCCPSTTEQQCNRVNANTQNDGVNVCAWVEDKCVPTFESRSLDIEHLLGENRDVWTYTFSSATANRGHSAYYPTFSAAEQELSADNSRLWVLEIDNNFGCSQQVDYSYVVAPNSGICEPSTRRMCDAAFEKCAYSMLTGDEFSEFAPKWYDIFEMESGNYRTCNCLKRKEVCYRKNGCLSTAKYHTILENCDEAGCGDWCNSAGAAQVSFLALLVAAVALLF